MLKQFKVMSVVDNIVALKTDFDLLAQSAAPKHIQGYNTSSTTIRVIWEFPPLAEQNGIIISYTVSYQAIGGHYRDSTKRYKQVTGASTETNLTRLEEYVLYNITVSAATTAGEGPTSTAISVRTAEDGKIINCYMKLVCILPIGLENVHKKLIFLN